MAKREEGPNGLSRFEVENRLRTYGRNVLAKPYEVTVWGIAKEEVTEPMILLLLFVGIIYTLWGNIEDALTIFAVIFMLVLVEIYNEYRAKKAIASLSKLSALKAKVVRDGVMT